MTIKERSEEFWEKNEYIYRAYWSACVFRETMKDIFAEEKKWLETKKQKMTADLHALVKDAVREEFPKLAAEMQKLQEEIINLKMNPFPDAPGEGGEEEKCPKCGNTNKRDFISATLCTKCNWVWP